jgi:hypothetical protein
LAKWGGNKKIKNMEETIEKFRRTKDKNMDLHNIVIEIDHYGEEFRSAIGIKKKIIAEQKEFLLRIDLEMKQQSLDIKAFKAIEHVQKIKGNGENG